MSVDELIKKRSKPFDKKKYIKEMWKDEYMLMLPIIEHTKYLSWLFVEDLKTIPKTTVEKTLIYEAGVEEGKRLAREEVEIKLPKKWKQLSTCKCKWAVAWDWKACPRCRKKIKRIK